MGNLFLNALKAVAFPLVISSLILGAYRMGEEGAFGTVGKKVIASFLFTSSLGALVGYAFVMFFQPGKGIVLPHEAVSLADGADFKSFLTGIIPDNLVGAAAAGKMPGLILFSLLFGYFISQIKEESKKVIIPFFEGVFAIMMKIINLVMALMPFGVFGQVAWVVGTTGFEGIASTMLFFCTVMLALGFFAFVVLPLLLIMRGISPIAHVKLVAPALVTAFTTCSSTVAMPVALERMQEGGEELASVSRFSLPLGATLSMAGTALYSTVTAFFIAQAMNLELPISMHLFILFMSIIASMGMAGIPSSCLIGAMIVLQTVGFPVEAIGVVLAVERFADMFRTTVNLFGSCTCTQLVAKAGEKPCPEMA